MQTYLAHHGIKGMRWGIRKKKESVPQRYKVDIKARKAKIRNLNLKLNSTDVTDGNYHQLQKALARENKELRNDRVKDRVNKGKLDLDSYGGKYFNKKYAEYKKKGFTSEEAKIYAYRSDKARKTLIAAAGLTVASLAAYAGYKKYKNSVDTVIKAGSKLQNITTFDRDLKDAMYVSRGLDKKKYSGMYGAQIRLMNQHKGDIFKNTYKVDKNIKVASHDSALKALSSMMSNDSTVKKEIERRINVLEFNGVATNSFKQMRTASKARKELESGKLGRNAMYAFNTFAVDHTPQAEKVNKAFYQELAKRGYNAVHDFNDDIIGFSGYNSVTADILFDTAGAMHLDNSKVLSNIQIGKDFLVGSSVRKLQLAGKYSGLILGAKALRDTMNLKDDTKTTKKNSL